MKTVMGGGTVTNEYAFYRPGATLAPFVEWGTGYRQSGIGPASFRGLPSPWLTLIVTLDDPLVITRHPDPGQPPSAHDFLLGGLHTAPALVTHEGSQSGIQLGLTPLGARALLGMPASELASRDVEATDVLGRLADEVRERVVSAPDWARRFAVLEELLGGQVRAGAGLPVRPEVGHAWQRLRQSRGAVSIASLAQETGWSPRHLRAQFRAETGLSPKAAARVIRFDRARRMLMRRHAAGQRDFLAGLAAECGYYDQAHLAREFRELAGCPPSQWLAEEFRNVQAALPGDAQSWLS
jgi:AraC-like DNA-binding protein